MQLFLRSYNELSDKKAIEVKGRKDENGVTLPPKELILPAKTEISLFKVDQFSIEPQYITSYVFDFEKIIEESGLKDSENPIAIVESYFKKLSIELKNNQKRDEIKRSRIDLMLDEYEVKHDQVLSLQNPHNYVDFDTGEGMSEFESEDEDM